MNLLERWDASGALRRTALAGGASGLLAGAVFWWTIQSQGMTSTTTGLLGLSMSGGWIVLHLVASAAAGAVLGTIWRHHSTRYAATVSGGLLFGLLWWIAGPLTFGPLVRGDGTEWSILQGQEAFPSLIGHLLYGGLAAIGFLGMTAANRRLRPVAEPAEAVPAGPKSRVVIVGGGFGGVGAAQRLEQLPSRGAGLETSLVSQSNYMLFTPMLAEVASSALDAQHISAPVRAVCPNTQFHRADVESIDAERRVVRVRTDPSAPIDELPYDQLVLALGSVPSYHGLPGLEEHSFSLKSLADATRLRNHVISLLERADLEIGEVDRRRLLTFVVVGGGFAGTEIIAELLDLVRSVARYYQNIHPDELRFVLVHSRDRILPELSPGLGGYALNKLRQRGIEFILNERLAGADSEGISLQSGARVETRTLVWTAGNQPNPLLATVPCEKSRGGAVLVDGTLRVRGMADTWAVGDCAQIPDPDNEGKFYPPTAQHALREGKHVAENIAAVLEGGTPKQFRFRAIGLLVALGHLTGVAEIRGLRFSGLIAWLMWRTIYLSKLPGTERKVRVALDWGLDLIFPRDIVVTSASTESRVDGAPRAAPAGPPARAEGDD